MVTPAQEAAEVAGRMVVALFHCHGAVYPQAVC